MKRFKLGPYACFDEAQGVLARRICVTPLLLPGLERPFATDSPNQGHALQREVHLLNRAKEKESERGRGAPGEKGGCQMFFPSSAVQLSTPSRVAQTARGRGETPDLRTSGLMKERRKKGRKEGRKKDREKRIPRIPVRAILPAEYPK